MATLARRSALQAAPALILLLGASVMLNYVDRGAIGVAAPLMKSELGLSATTFGVAVAAFVAPFASARADEPRRLRFHDLGNILLMYVLTWAYLAYTQFLVIWSENLPHEIQWYVPRVQTGWAALGVFLIAFHFFLPLAILLSRAAKRAPRLLGAIAIALLVAHLGDAFWLVAPTFRPAGFAIAWTDIAAMVVLGAVWGWAWRRAIVPLRAAAVREPVHG